ncbi:MAG: CaiB/BaiF CoA-transferase family protein [Chloroflexota bacterium]
MALALEGIKILTTALTSIAEFATMMLGDFGAEVIKIEPPGHMLGVGSGMSSSPTGERARQEAAVKAVNRNKKSFTLNLKFEEGRRIFHQMAESADVVVECFRPGVVKRLGIDYETISKINPRIVYCSISGYGQDGPYRDRPGHDPNYIAIGGALGLIGERGSRPVLPLSLVGDWSGGTMHTTIGILMALMARERTGKGQYVDISMTDGVVNLMLQYVQSYFETGIVPRIGEGGATAFPSYGVFETRDGKYISIGCLEPKFWANLCRVMGREDLSAPENAVATGEWGEEIKNDFRRVFLTRTRDEWFAELGPQDICLAPVYELDEVFTDPQVLHRRMVVEVEGPDGTRARQLGIALKLSDTPGQIRSLAPILGENTDEMLLALGYSRQDIKALREKGVV